MRFGVSSRTDMINILVLIEAVERKVSTEQVDVYKYMNMTDEELHFALRENGNKMKVNL